HVQFIHFLLFITNNITAVMIYGHQTTARMLFHDNAPPLVFYSLTPYWFSAKKSQILETHSVQSQVNAVTPETVSDVWFGSSLWWCRDTVLIHDSPSAGVFTAPLRGVYYFRFNLVDSSRSHMLAVCLYKNHKKVFDVSKYPQGTNEYAVGGAALLLEKGDQVDNLCSFSGFLLFAM
uniref:C1q domain-containing protein n=1 Tax=Pygocentrus nattereri TaxID=42514 RepID=A0AAR2LSB0_PYGNA